ncbi:MAG: type IV pilus assembly protein PilM [Candidatus Omnitrophota bacterium]
MTHYKSGKNESVGLDIGSYSVKVTSIEKQKNEKNKLTTYNVKKIPFDSKDFNLESCIHQTLSEVGLCPETLNLAVSGPDVIVRFINLPKMTRDQLGNALVFEAEKHIPFNINEVVLDSLILGDAGEEGQMRVLLAAAKRETITPIISTIKKLGIVVNVMDTNPLAMFNAFTTTQPKVEREGYVLFDFGYAQTDMLISAGDLPCFMREIPIGSKNITEAICQELNVSKVKAEEYKRGLIERAGEESEKVKQITRSILDELVEEIQLSFGYFENRHDMKISHNYCAGGMIYQDGVVEYISEKIGTQMEKWDPTRGIELAENISREDIDSVSSELAVSIGLALRG